MTSILTEATPLSHKRAELLISDVASADLTTAAMKEAATGSKASRLPSGDIRRSLRASTLDGTFSSAFENIVRGVLISNFLLGLGAGTFEIGLLSSIPMLTHLLQPLGAYFSEKTTSRHVYCLWIYGCSRVLWLLPAGGIFLFSHGLLEAHQLALITMGVLASSNVLDSIGCASWMSWMAVLVPNQLRGRYFSLRRSLSSLAALITIPVGGWIVSQWMGGEIEGYGIVLIIAVLMGLASLSFQFWMCDVNPQAEAAAFNRLQTDLSRENSSLTSSQPANEVDANRRGARQGWLSDRNFLTLLLFLGLWTFAFNLSAPFFNFYLLDHLRIDVQWVTLYGGLMQGAFFLMMLLWGRLADRLGNRPVLMIAGIFMSVLPLLWLYTDSSGLSVWLLLPLLHILQGGTFAALDLCLANIQLELAPLAKQSDYFAIAAAIIGITGAFGTMTGSLIAQQPGLGLPILFVLSAGVRLISLTPLFFVKETRAVSMRQLLQQTVERLPLREPTRAKA